MFRFRYVGVTIASKTGSLIMPSRSTTPAHGRRRLPGHVHPQGFFGKLRAELDVFPGYLIMRVFE